MGGSETRVALFTSQEIGHRLVSSFADRGDVALRVVTYDTDSDRYYGYPSVAALCRQRGVQHDTPKRVDASLVERIARFEPDLLITAYYAKILPRKALDLVKSRAFNIHPGKLPQYRGPFPTAWAIVNGETEFGITIHELDAGIDTGEILRQDVFPIEPDETGFELYARSMRLGADMIADSFDDLVAGKLRPVEQRGGGSYFGSFPARYQLEWSRTSASLHNLIRAHAPPFYPAFSFLKNKCVLVERATPIDVPGHVAQGPGRIVSVDGTTVTVTCGDGCLRIDRYQLVPLREGEDPTLHLHAGARFT